MSFIDDSRRPAPLQFTTHPSADDYGDSGYLTLRAGRTHQIIGRFVKFAIVIFLILFIVGFAPYAWPDGGRYLCIPEYWDFQGGCVTNADSASCAERFVRLMLATKASASACAIGVVFYAVILVSARSSTRSCMRKIANGEALPEKKISINESGISETHSGFSISAPWSAFRDVLESTDILYIRFGLFEGFVFPKRDLTPELRTALGDWIRTAEKMKGMG